MELQEYINNDKISELNLPFSTQNIDKMDFTKANEIINNTLFQNYNPYNLNNVANTDPEFGKHFEINNNQSNNIIAGVVPSIHNNTQQQLPQQQLPQQQSQNIQYVIEDNLIDQIMEEENTRLQNLDILPNINDVIMLYLSHIKRLLLPKNKGIEKIGILILRLIQIISILYILLGWLFPNATLKYHIGLCIFTILSWEIFDDHSMISVIIEKIFNPHLYSDIVPISINTCKYATILLLCISIYGMYDQNNSIFNIVKNFINNIN